MRMYVYIYTYTCIYIYIYIYTYTYNVFHSAPISMLESTRLWMRSYPIFGSSLLGTNYYTPDLTHMKSIGKCH